MMHLEEITAAVSLGQAGDHEAARRQLSELWDAVDDPQTRCAIAHYLADVQDETVDELTWDLRALEVVEDVAWLPSLHLNLADDYRRLGQSQQAEEHLRLAREHLHLLQADGYGELLRSAVDHVTEALAVGNTQPLPTNPSSA
jgi:Tetratricopeptide repeat